MTAQAFTAVSKKACGTNGAKSFSNFPLTADGVTALAALTAANTVDDVLKICNDDIRTALAVTTNSTGQATSSLN